MTYGAGADPAVQLVLDAVEKLIPEFEARAVEAETLRTMPPDLSAMVKSAGLFRLALPRTLGGMELDLETIVRVVERVSRADASAGWTLLIGMGSTAFFAWLDPAVAKEMIGDNPDFCSSCVFGPMGQAVPDGNSFTVNGRWSFNSGCMHSEWLQFGVFVMDGATPRFRDGQTPDWRFAFIPRADVTIEDTWDSLGLRGTGSHHVTVSGANVPEEHLAAPVFDLARHDGPMWRLPLFTFIGPVMAAFPLGVARRALDEFTEIARRKFRGGPLDAVAQDGHAQAHLAKAEAGLQAARAFLYEVVGELWESCVAGDSPTPQQRARTTLACNHAMRAGVEAVDAVYPFAGAEAVMRGGVVERCFRDIHTANQHIIFSSNRLKSYAKLQFGIDQPTHML